MERIVRHNNTEILVKSYQPKVEVAWATPEPWRHVYDACSTTQKGMFAESGHDKHDKAVKLIPYLMHANHTSVLEHAVINFKISNISRATLDQVVRHRVASYTASSTHYQDHVNYEHFVDALSFSIPGFVENIAQAMDMYALAVRRDTQTARQLLPLSVGSVLRCTVNARSLLNFLNLRMCRRNTVEMFLLAQEIYHMCCMWFTECFKCFECVGPDCHQHSGCRQGKMRCTDADQYRINSNEAAKAIK